jgi:hypothetical protein
LSEFVKICGGINSFRPVRKCRCGVQ